MKKPVSRRIFEAVNVILLTLMTLCAVLPFLNFLAISLSESSAVALGQVGFWPRRVTLQSYAFVLQKLELAQAFGVSVAKVLVGVPLNMLLTLLIAYPLSKSKEEFPARNVYVWFFIVTMIFSGGLVPWFLIISKLGMIDSFWALVIPSAVPVYNVVILVNFFKGIPKGIEEAATIDGATHWQILWRIFVPLSSAALASTILFCVVNHWNSWFEGMMLMNRPSKYPLQTYLQTFVVGRNTQLMSSEAMRNVGIVSERTARAAQMFVATVPVLMIYPFMQKYFTTGVTLGGVKE